MNKVISSTNFLDFKSAPSPNGSDWYYVKRTNDNNKFDSAVVISTIVKIDNEYNFLFLKTLRPPIISENKAKYCIEFPAGLIADIDKNEDLITCTKKELLEETGLSTDKIFIEANNYSSSCGLSSETLSFVTAIVEDNKITNEPISDGGIIIDRFYIKVKDIYEFLNNIDNKEYSISTASVCAIFFALKRLNLN